LGHGPISVVAWPHPPGFQSLGSEHG